jgi:chaperonin GroEL
VICDETGLALEHAELDWFGTARRVIVTAGSATFVEGAGSAEAVAARLGQIRGEIERAMHDRDREVAQERLATLSSKLAVISVGAATDVELNEKRRRAEGALAATRAAVAALLTTEAIVAEELLAQPCAVIAPGFGDLAEGLARPSSPI